MVGLVDIAPAAETVSIRGKEVEVYGVSAKGFAHLLARFPELRAMMAGRDVTADVLMASVGDGVAAIIAAGCGCPGDKKAEDAAGRLTVEEQADLLSAILKLTMPKGVGPFVQKLMALAGSLGVDVQSATVPDGTSESASPPSSKSTASPQLKPGK